MAVVVWVGEVKSALYQTVSRKYTTYWARSGKKGLELAKHHQAKLTIIDAHSFKTNGSRIVEAFQKHFDNVALLLITHDSLLRADVVELPPDVTSRRFMQHVHRLLNATPAQWLHFGGAELDVAGARLIIGGCQVSLNPKQCRLCEVFFRHGGEVVPRAVLMREVWDTDYLGDTRTLEVHVRWLRHKLDGHREYHRLRLVTVRGVGYRMEEMS